MHVGKALCSIDPSDFKVKMLVVAEYSSCTQEERPAACCRISQPSTPAKIFSKAPICSSAKHRPQFIQVLPPLFEPATKTTPGPQCTLPRPTPRTQLHALSHSSESPRTRAFPKAKGNAHLSTPPKGQGGSRAYLAPEGWQGDRGGHGALWGLFSPKGAGRMGGR